MPKYRVLVTKDAACLLSSRSHHRNCPVNWCRQRAGLVDVRIDEDRAVYLRTRQDGEHQELASTRGTLGTTIKWRTS
ncbi:hypothetical protein ACVIWV_009545 [Bradyrhizobium diazoefficiens]